MQIILLSGGSGKRLWPLSNNIRSKQFLKLLLSPDGYRESMLQRIVRQLKYSNIDAEITVATSNVQEDLIKDQLGEQISIVSEPSRRDTFPAIALACSYLAFEKHCSDDEIVVVMPCDAFTDNGYFETIQLMAEAVKNGISELILMGIKPTCASEKFGYIVPGGADIYNECTAYKVSHFVEKPDKITAENLIKENAFWNGGVFVFQLKYMMNIIRTYVSHASFQEIRNHYEAFPKISFDYEVVEKAQSISVISFNGKWCDLGTWNSFAKELHGNSIGNIIMDEDSVNTHIINELDIPVLCVGTENLMVVVSNDGILVANKEGCENIKNYVDRLNIKN